jgi:hypothetical protein
MAQAPAEAPIDLRWEAKRALFQSVDPEVHRRAREILGRDNDFLLRVSAAYLQNPFLRLTEEESAQAPATMQPPAVGQLVAARDAATRSTAPRHVVCCMPKSGSSFLASALQHAVELPRVSLTSFGSGGASSAFGMNSREQELDEMAVTKSVLTCSQGFVAQHHTRYSQYLALQMKLYGLSPLVTMRNALDCIVSFDDMVIARGPDAQHWVSDAQFAFPAGYSRLSEDIRYTILTHSFGVWLINFYLSWKRGQQQAIVSPLMIKYEDHVLNPEALVEHLNSRIPMTGEQIDRLRTYAKQPDPTRSRLNVGTRGRGEQKLPEHLKQFLLDYAGLFASELTPEDIRYLIC